MTDNQKKFWDDLKAKHPDALLLFRCGDFYETYEEDAKECARVLGITLTKRSDTGTAMAGFPHHALDTYLPKLIRAGKRVAICDQLEDPKLTKKLVKRGITELVSPATNNSNNIQNSEDKTMKLNLSNNESKNVQSNAQVNNEVESVNVGEVTLATIMPKMQTIEGSEYGVKDDSGKEVKFESVTPAVPAPTKPAVNTGRTRIVVAGVPKPAEKKPVTLKKKQTQPKSTEASPTMQSTEASPTMQSPEASPTITLSRVRLVVYTTARTQQQAPRIEGFTGEDDPRWKKHYDEKLRLKALKDAADKKNEKLRKAMKGKTKAERDEMMKRWVTVPNDPFNASYFSDRTTGDKTYSLVMGAKYLDVAQQLVDAYNTNDRSLWAEAEQAVADVKQGIVAERVAEREARKAARSEATTVAAPAPATSAPQGKVFTEDTVRQAFATLAAASGMDVKDFEPIISAMRSAA